MKSVFILCEHKKTGNVIMDVYANKDVAIAEASRLRVLHGLFYYILEKEII